MSAAMQSLADVERMNGLRGPVGLYLLTIAMSGDRKSTADGRFTAAIREYEREKEAEYAPIVRDYRANLKAWAKVDEAIQSQIKSAASGRAGSKGKNVVELENDLRVHEAKKPSEPRIPRLIHGDATSEALGWSLAKKWPAAAIISSEAGIVLGGHAMGSETIMRNLGLQNTLWDGGEHHVERRAVDGSFTVRGARLTIGLQMQEEALYSFCEKNGALARGIGLLRPLPLFEAGIDARSA